MPKRKPHQSSRPKPTTTISPSDTGLIFFYLPWEKPYGIFCQWYPSPITIPTSSLSFLLPSTSSPNTPNPLTEHGEILTFNCAEQLYMYAKTLYFPSTESHSLGAQIFHSTDPKEQKALARHIPHFNESKWSDVRERVVELGNYYKFKQNRHMKGVLLGTGERELWEASRSDRVWGIGYRADEAEKYRRNWGEGLLGKCLIRVRERLRAEEAEKNGEVWDGWEEVGEQLADGAEWDGQEEENALRADEVEQGDKEGG